MSGMELGVLDFKYLLIEYYKKLRINENELAVILMIDHLLEQKNTLITPDLLAIKMSLTMKELDQILVSLMDRKFVVFEVDKKMKVSLKPLQKKLVECFKKDMVQEQEIQNSEKKTEALKNLKKFFEEELNRQLSPLESSLIQDWIERGYSEVTIENALKDCLLKGKRTLKSVDKLLLQWQTKDDYDKAKSLIR